MSGRTPRIIGTTEQSIDAAEAELNFRFPPSFRSWLLEKNGSQIDGVETIYSVYDGRDPRKTWDSIVRNYRESWMQCFEGFSDYYPSLTFKHLLPFAEVGNSDCYCFDYSRKLPNGETPIVLWFHETGETENRAENFAEFVDKAKRGEYEMD